MRAAQIHPRTLLPRGGFPERPKNQMALRGLNISSDIVALVPTPAVFPCDWLVLRQARQGGSCADHKADQSCVFTYKKLVFLSCPEIPLPRKACGMQPPPFMSIA